MPRTPDGPVARSVSKTIRMTPATLAAADRQRGRVDFSEYVRRLIVQDGRRQKQPEERES